MSFRLWYNKHFGWLFNTSVTEPEEIPVEIPIVLNVILPSMSYDQYYIESFEVKHGVLSINYYRNLENIGDEDEVYTHCYAQGSWKECFTFDGYKNEDRR